MAEPGAWQTSRLISSVALTAAASSPEETTWRYFLAASAHSVSPSSRRTGGGHSIATTPNPVPYRSPRETGLLHGIWEQILDGLMEMLEYLPDFEESEVSVEVRSADLVGERRVLLPNDLVEGFRLAVLFFSLILRNAGLGLSGVGTREPLIPKKGGF